MIHDLFLSVWLLRHVAEFSAVWQEGTGCSTRLRSAEFEMQGMLQQYAEEPFLPRTAHTDCPRPCAPQKKKKRQSLHIDGAECSVFPKLPHPVTELPLCG